jgi:hypothetical protein
MTNFPRELADQMESYVEANESPGSVGPAGNKLFKNDVANALRWASIALIGIFIASVIAVPPPLIDPFPRLNSGLPLAPARVLLPSPPPRSPSPSLH